jgi:hypothetical protein
MAVVSFHRPDVVQVVVLRPGRQQARAAVAVPAVREAPAGGWPWSGLGEQVRAAAAAGLADLAAQAGGRPARPR